MLYASVRDLAGRSGKFAGDGDVPGVEYFRRPNEKIRDSPGRGLLLAGPGSLVRTQPRKEYFGKSSRNQQFSKFMLIAAVLRGHDLTRRAGGAGPAAGKMSLDIRRVDDSVGHGRQLVSGESVPCSPELDRQLA